MMAAQQSNGKMEQLLPDFSRSYAQSLVNNYGITCLDYDNLWLDQEGRCAICGTDKPAGKGARLHVDHCHETGRVRGLLCQRCNGAIGLLGDCVESLVDAVGYLAKFEKVGVVYLGKPRRKTRNVWVAQVKEQKRKQGKNAPWYLYWNDSSNKRRRHCLGAMTCDNARKIRREVQQKLNRMNEVV